jgi:hypothetical protein
VAFEIEVIVDQGLTGGELLVVSHRPEPGHDLLSPPEWSVRVFRRDSGNRTYIIAARRMISGVKYRNGLRTGRG